MDNKDIEESIRTKLKNFAKSDNRDFDNILLQFFQERFLYRISISKYRNNFILKGALLLMIKNISVFRPTKDIDFLGKSINPDPNQIEGIIKQIMKIGCNDGVTYLSEHIISKSINGGAGNKGVSLKITARLGKIKKVITMDIGFGDIIYKGSREITFPTILDFPAPIVKCYPYESIIAEKFHAIVWLNFQTSRMKDFYDIHFLLKNQTFKSTELMGAITSTFKRRNTNIDQRNVIFSDSFKSDRFKQVQWEAFLRKSELKSYKSFKSVIQKIERFIGALFNLDENITFIWDNKSCDWIKNN
jgi:hypothetical protein